MSSKLVEELYNRIENEELHLYFEGDKQTFLLELESLKINGELTYTEHDELLIHIEDTICGIDDCILEAMIECDPDLAD
ncbi:hypothetical protein G9F71_008360 [Clostridium sp. FP2]|uniref:hypothetical protein n=1 Tax=Clostridium sp. FP2 TaxID=2724481 RepID=UPI0013E9778C|nr:hypothetical protein [Clostridium sp. FP2]MBZ9622864.1 hypothetical protein [Clostridium sp. FP2]